jgi:hypothetical protein
MIRTAVLMLTPHRALFEAFEKEAQDLESFGPVLHPGLYLQAQREPWRQDVRAMFAASLRFIREAERISASFERHATGDRDG